MKGLFFFVFILIILPVCITSVGYDPDYRPPGLPTYTPPSPSDFNVTLFTAWVWSQVSLGVSEIAVAYGSWPVFPSGVPGSSYPFLFTNLTNFIMWFDNVTLVFQDYTQGGVQFDSCSNVTLHGMTTIYNEPTFSQALVTNITISPTNKTVLWVDVEICAGYPNRYMFNQSSIYGFIFNGTTRLAYEPDKMNEIHSFLSPSQNLTDDGSKLRFFLSPDYITSGSLNVGDYITARGYFTSFFHAVNSAYISYIDVTILNCGGYGFFAYAGVGGHVYRRVRITYAPPPSVPGAVAPLITCAADGFHYIAAEKGPTIQNSLFEGMQDDAIAIHGLYGNVTNVNHADGQFRITAPYCRYVVGDTLRIYTPSYVPRGYVTVSAVQQEPDGSMNVTLTGSIINSIQVDDIVTDMSRQSNGFLIENTLIRWHRARGMLIKASNGIIRNNIVNGSTIGGIYIKPEPLSEADYGQNITIEKNWVSDSGFFYDTGSICVFTYVPNANEYPLAGGFVNILINNNTILRSSHNNILVTSTVNATVTNNRIVGPLLSSSAAVNLANIDGVTVVENVVYHSNTTSTVLLQMSNVINSHGNLTAGVYFNETTDIPVLPDWPGMVNPSSPPKPNATRFFS